MLGETMYYLLVRCSGPVLKCRYNTQCLPPHHPICTLYALLPQVEDKTRQCSLVVMRRPTRPGWILLAVPWCYESESNPP